MARSSLHVEGKNDLHAIAHLVKRHGIDYASLSDAPEIKAIGSDAKVIEGIEAAVKLHTGRAIGFVLDADSSAAGRWASIRQHLGKSGVDGVPASPPEGGFLGASSRFKSRVGVWIMPNNRDDGALESFLRDLVAEDDPIIAHAESATDAATTLGAAFPPKHRMKAVIYTWLAWQEAPGKTYGQAIDARSFRHDRPMARRFVRWYADLYGLTLVPTP